MGSLVHAVCRTVDDATNLSRIAGRGRSNPLGSMPTSHASRGELREYVEAVWSCRKLLESRTESIVAHFDELQKGRNHLSQAIQRIVSGRSARDIGTGFQKRTYSVLSDNAGIEAVAALYHLRNKCLRRAHGKTVRRPGGVHRHLLPSKVGRQAIHSENSPRLSMTGFRTVSSSSARWLRSSPNRSRTSVVFPDYWGRRPVR